MEMKNAITLLESNFNDHIVIEGHEDDIDIIYFEDKRKIGDKKELYNLSFEDSIYDNSDNKINVLSSTVNKLADLKNIYKAIYPIPNHFLVSFIDGLNIFLKKIDVNIPNIPYFDEEKLVYNQELDMSNSSFFRVGRITKEYIVTDSGIYEDAYFCLYFKQKNNKSYIIFAFFINNINNPEGINILKPNELNKDEYIDAKETVFDNTYFFNHLKYQLKYPLKKIPDIDLTFENFGDTLKLLEIINI